MNTKELLYFKTVVDEGSISRAARKLYIAQPSLSQFIKRIEESVGTPLYRRSANGITLTYAGERYYAMASNILKICDDFQFEIGDLSDLNAGRIQCGITIHLGTYLLPRVLPEFIRKYPNIQIDAFEATSPLQEQRLLENRLDFSLMHLPDPKNQAEALRYETLGTDPFVILLPPGSPLREKMTEGELDPRLLKDVPMVMTNKGQRIRQIEDELLAKAGIPHPNCIFSSTNINTVQQCVAAGIGAAVLPLKFVSPEILAAQAPADSSVPASSGPAAASVPASAPVLCTIPARYRAVWNVCAAMPKSAYLTKADQVFLDLVREYI